MTPQEQNEAIAEALGWTQNNVACTRETKHKWFNPNDGCCYAEIPDFVNDANAIRQAEELLRDLDAIWPAYYDHLLIDCCNNDISEAIIASPQQKAKAFLLTIGKWKN